MSDAQFRALARAAAASYEGAGRFARHFAYGKLTGDPVFEWILREGIIAPGTRVLDLGCGQGLLGALLFAANVGEVRYEGIDLRSRDVERARAMAASLSPALASRASFRAGDIRYEPFPAADVVVLLDVLHYIDYRAQAGVFDRALEALGEGGYLVVRVADAAASARFQWTLFVDRLAMRLRGQGPHRLYCRSLAAWREHLERRRLAVRAIPMSSGTLFANVVLLARYDR